MSPQELFATLESRYRLPEGYLNRVYQLESGGGKNNYNKLSGAAGPFQFMPGTQKGMGLQDPYSLEQSAEAAARLAAQNRDFLKSKGVEEVDGKLLYLAHAQGPAGAYALLSNPDAKAVDALAPLYKDRSVAEKAVTQNLGKVDQPAGSFAESFMNRFEGAKGAKPAAYAALGDKTPVGETAQETPQASNEEAALQEAAQTASDSRRSDRREMYALNTLMGLTKELEGRPAPMLPIPRLSFQKGGIVSLVDGEETAEAPAERMAGTRFGALPPSMLESRPDVTPVMFGGEKAEGIDPQQLERARKMIAEGVDPKDVYAKTRTENTTGWFVGPDGKLRFEFSDKDAALDNKVFESLKKGGTTTLGDVLKHDDLFKYYPGAKDVTVRLLTKEEQDEGLNGFYDPKTNLLAISSDPKQASSTILHESQHFIQEKEGFSPGGSDAGIVPLTQINMIMEEMELANKRGELRKQDSEDKGKRVQELLNRGVPFEEAMKEWEKGSPLGDKYDAEVFQPFVKKRREYELGMTKLGPFESYRRLSGETEARNVQTRAPMSLEERAGSYPQSTQDYKNEELFAVPPRRFAEGGIVDLVTGPEQKPGINVPATTAAVVQEIQDIAENGNLDEYKIAFLLRMAATNTIPPDRALAFANEILSGDVQALLVRFRRYPRALRMLARLDLSLGGLAGQGYGIVANQHPRVKPQPLKRMGHDTKTAQAFAKGGEVGGHNEKAQFDLSKFAVAAYGPEIGNNMIRRSEGDPNKLFYALNQYAKNAAGPQSLKYKRNLAALQAIAKRHRLNPVQTFNRTEDALSTEQELDKLIRDVPKKDRVFRDAMLRMKAMVGWKPKPRQVRS
jgi:hypothetical protein